MAPAAGRFAPSPSADLHIGNLRTAVLAWLFDPHEKSSKAASRTNASAAERISSRRRAAGRPPALQLRSDVAEYTVTDVLHGDHTGTVDDVVQRRGDRVPAYNLAVVVYDAAQGVDRRR